MTFEDKLTAKVAEAQAQHEANRIESLQAVLENPAFIEAQRSISAKDAELKRLNAIINQLNQIKPFITKDGTKYSIQCYPVSFFGTGLAQVIGIISASRSAFTDELALQYSAITGISILELAEANEALGSPTYLSKDGTISPAMPCSLSKFRQLLASIMLKTNIHEFNPDVITQDRVDLWFAKAELAVERKSAELEATQAINASSSFTIED